MAESLPLDKLRLDGGTQPRDHIKEDVVKQYVEDMVAGAEFPPVTVFSDGSDYWLADGFHRVTACHALGVKHISADVRPGTRRGAMLFACGANATHGYPRTNADKRRAVFRLLNDEEWGKWSDREIARRCCVHHDMVGKLRATLSGGNRQIQPDRTATRGGTTYEMNTANIGGGGKSGDGPADPDSLTPPPSLGRRQPAFPREHANSVGQIDCAVRMFIEGATITPAEALIAMVGERTAFWANAKRTVAWLSELLEEKERETD